MKMRMLIAAIIFLMAGSLAQGKDKYGPEAILLSKAHSYLQKAEAPDYWALSPYYIAQQDDAACSLASVTMIVNGARGKKDLTSDDELATQPAVLKKAGVEVWTQFFKNHKKQIVLDDMSKIIAASLKAYGIENAKTEIIHADDTSAATKEKIHRALVENEKSSKDFIIANFIQGTYTGDADIGHVAPVGAYDADKKAVLIFDPDRQWYEPYWVSEETFVKGLATLDKGAKKNRGIVWVKLN